MFYGFKKNPVDRGAAQDFGTTTEETTQLDQRLDSTDIIAAEPGLFPYRFSARRSGDSVFSVNKTFYCISPAKDIAENCNVRQDLRPGKFGREGLSLRAESYTLERDVEMSGSADAFVLTVEHFQAMIERISLPGQVEPGEPSARLAPSRRGDRV